MLSAWMLLLLGDQWLQFDIGPASLVTGVVTRGRGDSSKRQWVTRYKLAYSNNTQDWIFYNDASHLDPKVCYLPVLITCSGRAQGDVVADSQWHR